MVAGGLCGSASRWHVAAPQPSRNVIDVQFNCRISGRASTAATTREVIAPHDAEPQRHIRIAIRAASRRAAGDGRGNWPSRIGVRPRDEGGQGHSPRPKAAGIGAFGIAGERRNKLALSRLPPETNPEIIHVFEELFVGNIDLISEGQPGRLEGSVPGAESPSRRGPGVLTARLIEATRQETASKLGSHAPHVFRMAAPVTAMPAVCWSSNRWRSPGWWLI